MSVLRLFIQLVSNSRKGPVHGSILTPSAFGHFPFNWLLQNGLSRLSHVYISSGPEFITTLP